MENDTQTTVSSDTVTWSNDAEGFTVFQKFYERQLFAAIIGSIAIVGSVGNSFVIAAVSLSRKLRTATNVFVVNLAVADVMTCLFVPWQAVAILGAGEWPIPQAPWLCTLAGFVPVVTFGCSTNNLALIAVNRWVGITKSRYTTRRIYTTRKLAVMVAISWAVPLCCALTPLLTDFGELGFEPLYSSCTWVISKSVYYSMLVTAICYPLQLILIAISYTSIMCYVFKTSRRMSQADAPSVSDKISGKGSNNSAMRKKLWKRQLDVTKNLLYIVLVFLACLTPYFTAIIFSSDWSRLIVPWAGVTLFFNSSINPVIYATTHPDFKEAFAYMVRCKKIPSRAGSSMRFKSSRAASSEVNRGFEAGN